MTVDTFNCSKEHNWVWLFNNLAQILNDFFCLLAIFSFNWQDNIVDVVNKDVDVELDNKDDDDTDDDLQLDGCLSRTLLLPRCNNSSFDDLSQSLSSDELVIFIRSLISIGNINISPITI